MRTIHWVSVAFLCVGALALVTQAAKQREPGLYARFETTMGNITVRLFEAETPITVKNFVDLAEGKKAWLDPNTRQKVMRPLYNGVIFHRVIPGFMIQGGDPGGTGAYSPGFTIPDEIVSSLKFDRPGRLAMANIGQKNTGGCQFFITEVPYPSLNNGYTIFGQVVDGQDLVQKIANVPRGANDKPRTPVMIKQVVIEREGPPAAP
jgi:peptidyl-prolyl cis-trans isomerase A (cyclophilin A)